MITQIELKEQVAYNPITGVFTRKIALCNKVKVGDVAGFAHKENSYIHIRVKKKKYKAHRLAWLYMTGKWPKNQIDHKNHIRDDNRWINLREATYQENNKNISLRKDNISGVNGVFWNKALGKWQSQVRVNSKAIHLGFHLDFFEAVCSRKSADNKHGFHPNHGKISPL